MPIVLSPAEPVALICAVMADAETTLAEAKDALSSRIGPIRWESPVYSFDYSAYYEPEMGADLIKQLICFEDLVDPAILPQVKQRTMDLEKEMGKCEAGELLRRANIDPGLISIESLVLATTKYSGHRICIAPGLYAEITLLYQKGRYAPQQWTYADYRSKEVQQFLLEIRSDLMQRRQRQDI